MGKRAFIIGGINMDRRIGVIGIVVESREDASRRINTVLSEYGEIIVGRMGVPYRDRNISIISLIVDGSTDEIGAMTGKLGILAGVKVKTALLTKG
jgi:putative iron-only hydrogenase system regulator